MQGSLFKEEDSFARYVTTGKKPIICHRGLYRAVLVTKGCEHVRNMAFRIFPKKRKASWHGAYSRFS